MMTATAISQPLPAVRRTLYPKKDIRNKVETYSPHTVQTRGIWFLPQEEQLCLSPVPCSLYPLLPKPTHTFPPPCSSPPHTLKLMSLTSSWSPPCILCFSALMASRPQTHSSCPAPTHQPGLGAAWRDAEFAGSSRQSCRQLEAEHCTELEAALSFLLPVLCNVQAGREAHLRAACHAEPQAQLKALVLKRWCSLGSGSAVLPQLTSCTVAKLWKSTIQVFMVRQRKLLSLLPPLALLWFWGVEFGLFGI